MFCILNHFDSVNEMPFDEMQFDQFHMCLQILSAKADYRVWNILSIFSCFNFKFLKEIKISGTKDSWFL